MPVSYATSKGGRGPSDPRKKKRKKRTASRSRPEKVEIVEPQPLIKFLKFAWNVIFYIFIVAVFIGALMFNFNDAPDKSFYGYRFMTVKTNSMAPNPDKPTLKDGFLAGDVIILKQINPDELVINDIITFYPIEGNTKAYLTHRIIEIGTKIDDGANQIDGLTTQGDANEGQDIPIAKERVVGKVIGHIPSVGRGIEFMRNNLVVVLVLVIAIFSFGLTLKYYLGLPKLKPTKRRKKSY